MKKKTMDNPDGYDRLSIAYDEAQKTDIVHAWIDYLQAQGAYVSPRKIVSVPYVVTGTGKQYLYPPRPAEVKTDKEYSDE